MKQKEKQIEKIDNWKEYFIVCLIVAIYLGAGFVTTANNYQRVFSQLNNSLVIPNSQIIPEQECKVIEKNASDLCNTIIENSEEQYKLCQELIANYKTIGMIYPENFCETFSLNKILGEECLKKYKNQTYNETICRDKPIKECVERVCAREPTPIKKCFNGTCERSWDYIEYDCICTKWKYNFEVKE